MALLNSGSTNPALRQRIFENHPLAAGQEAMTFTGTINKFMFMFLMLVASSIYSWNAYSRGANIAPLLVIGLAGGLILAVVISFKKEWSPYLAPAYGLLEGLFVGAISAYLNNAFRLKAPFIVMQAVLLTFGVVIAMLILYKTGIIKVTNRFVTIVIAATAGIAFFYLLTIALQFFHIQIPFVYGSSNIGIIFSLVVVGIAAMNLAIDFAMIDQGAQNGAPKYFEWYCAFGLMVTIVWLYIEILRLLTKLYSRK
ncbi:MAG TPA: Bax inhibitor-1/YccA family protein [Chitinophagaceae bacterium]|nr:Bax inhibitor-1/YccA family protein [Chitinophagaceae bacterium]